MNYVDYRTVCTNKGNAYQDYIERAFLHYMDIELNCYKKKIQQYLIGENKAGIEIKFDGKFRRRNPPALWIEYAEKAQPRPGPYAPSGIFRHDNSWLFVIGDYATIHIFGIKTLQRIFRRNKVQQKYEWIERPTSQAFLLPIEGVALLAEKIISVDEDTQKTLGAPNA